MKRLLLPQWSTMKNLNRLLPSFPFPSFLPFMIMILEILKRLGFHDDEDSKSRKSEGETDEERIQPDGNETKAIIQPMYGSNRPVKMFFVLLFFIESHTSNRCIHE